MTRIWWYAAHLVMDARDEYAHLVKTLEDLDGALGEMSIDIMEIRTRIRVIAEGHRHGQSLRGNMPDGRAVIARRLSELSRVLDQYGSRVRRLMAAQLVHEGSSASEIATAFGVSRQRVSKLLKEVEAQRING